MKNQTTHTAGTGALYATVAYVTWGLFPIFWKLFQGVAHERVLAHRIVWSALFFAALLLARHGKAARTLLSETFRHWPGLLLSGVLLGANWFIYIYAVNSGYVLESSFGYFITPLVNVVLGLLFLKERLRTLQWVALALATIGMLLLIVQGDRFPFIALSLALTFGSYGFVRKKLALPPLAASAVESLFLSVPALAYFVLTPALADSAIKMTDTQACLLVLGGAITALPLLWFAEAAKRLPLSTLAFFQYLTPSLQLLLAIFAYGEPFTALHARSFTCIWLGLSLCTLDALGWHRARNGLSLSADGHP